MRANITTEDLNLDGDYGNRNSVLDRGTIRQSIPMGRITELHESGTTDARSSVSYQLPRINEVEDESLPNLQDPSVSLLKRTITVESADSTSGVKVLMRGHNHASNADVGMN